MTAVQLSAPRSVPDIRAGDALADILVSCLREERVALGNKTILAIAQKIVSKAEGRLVPLAGVIPGERARALAKKLNKDPRKVELILSESREIIRLREPVEEGGEGLIISRHRRGYICANAGIDESNVGEDESVLLLPEDSDSSARQLRARILALTGCAPGIVITDTFGRPWRNGLVNVAIGLAGVPAVMDLCGQSDAWGRPLRVTKPALADELAAASGLLMGKNAKTPVIVFEGIDWRDSESDSGDLIRAANEDLFL